GSSTPIAPHRPLAPRPDRVPAAGNPSPSRAGFGEASRPAWWIVAGCGLLIGVIGSCTTGRWGRRTAETTAAALAAA
ncbi:hypothetical protein, partial [Saccharopolyspora kobensis]|uniref:hypothetical protein n=1 Tax=Saccharopolyspora kobensis TaxID=146035 RepID=UPI00335F68A5